MASILLVETATRVCSVGIANENGIVALREDLTMQYSHSSQLTTFIEEVVKEAGLVFSQLDAVAVSMGPGSYTGLRIGVSASKGLCYALEIPLIAVDSLYVLANVAKETISEPVDFYLPMIDARRMEVYNAVYDSSLHPLRETAAEIIDGNSFQEYLQKGKVALFGDGAAKCADTVNHENALYFNDIYSSAKGLVHPAWVKFNQRQFEDVAYFEPFYLKDFVAGNPRVKGLK
jgi:tRNA threonylcarbamoyladenosine biosynthesis protein TsaB